MANVYIKTSDGGETTTLGNDDGFAVDTGTTSPWIKASNLAVYVWNYLTSLTAKTTLVDADQIGIADSAASNVGKKITVANFKTTLKIKGRAEILSVNPPATLGAPVGVIAGGSTPAENYMYFTFADAAIAYMDFKCRLIGYNGGGLTVNFSVLRTSASAAAGYVFEAAIRRINTGTEDITASHSYAYNAVTVTVPAGPPAAGIPMAGVITFTDGADMDSLADNEEFILRFRRDPTNGSDNAGDTARVLSMITIRET